MNGILRLYFIYIIVNLFYINLVYAITKVQMKKTFKIMKNQCMPKNGVTEDEVGAIDQGKFLEERKVMCYIACVYKTAQIIKNNRLSREAISKQVDVLYPAELKEPARAAIEKCIHVQDNYEDICEASYWSAKCMYEADPPNFVFA